MRKINHLPPATLETSYLETVHSTLPGQEASNQGAGVDGNSKESKRGRELPSGAGRPPPPKSKGLSLPCLSPAILAARTLLPLVTVSTHVHPREVSGSSCQTQPNFLSALSWDHTASAVDVPPPRPLPSLPLSSLPPGSSPYSQPRCRPPYCLVLVLSTCLKWQTSGTASVEAFSERSAEWDRTECKDPP